MRFKSILVFSLLLTTYALPLYAQNPERELSSGLNYTTVYNKPKPAAADTPDVPQAQSPLKPIAPKISMTAPAAPPETKEDSQTRIWNKYKALATGKAGEEQQNTAPPTEQKPAATQTQGMHTKTLKTDLVAAPQQSAPAPAPASGITAILQEWKSSKSQQSEMRSKSFKVPDTLAEPKTAPTTKTLVE
jgi:hypothetical protein